MIHPKMKFESIHLTDLCCKRSGTESRRGGEAARGYEGSCEGGRKGGRQGGCDREGTQKKEEG